jgi:ketosteroid isomerase-like protein
MSQENVETVRRVFEAEVRRDTALFDAVMDPALEMDQSDSPFGDFAEAKPRHGRQEVQETFRDWYATFENVQAEVSELIDAGEHVISVFTYRGRGRVSGVEVEFKDMAGLWTLRDGKIVRIVWFRTLAQALEAVGLSE